MPLVRFFVSGIKALAFLYVSMMFGALILLGVGEAVASLETIVGKTIALSVGFCVFMALREPDIQAVLYEALVLAVATVSPQLALRLWPKRARSIPPEDQPLLSPAQPKLLRGPATSTPGADRVKALPCE